MPEKADDAAGLSPSKEDNAFWRNLDQKEWKILIRFSYQVAVIQKGLLQNCDFAQTQAAPKASPV